ncbi:uncharacterized protein BN811_00211 [Clostridium sp. CAG:921]|nr:uncharacterized protein BN811_00211 [Clostridium sp. CAG:921]
MVNDKEVKTVVSPFAVRENEIKVFDGKEGFASINQVVFKMDMGYINEYHIKVLEVVNEFGFITSRQVTQILELRGKLNDIEEEKRQNKVAKWLEDLTKSKVIARYFFQSEAGKSSYRAYAMDKIATYILKQRNIPTTWQPTDNTKPAYAVKRKLAGNQIIIAYMQKVAAYSSSTPNVLLYSKKYNVKFKPTGGMVTLKNGTDEENFVFEVVRRNEDWQNMFAEKVQLYSDFYENFTRNDAGFYEKPQLVIVGEDIQHIAEIFRIIKKVGIVLKDDEIYFTTELKHLENDLVNSINVFELEPDSRKYKLVVKPLEILKPGEKEENNELKTDVKFNPNMVVE